MLTALTALAGGCSKAYIADPNEKKVKVAETLAAPGQITGITVDVSDPNSLRDQVYELTGNGVNVTIECSSVPLFPTPGGKQHSRFALSVVLACLCI